MDDLVDKLEGSFQVTKSENSIYAPHPNERKGLYKSKTPKAADQNIRRERYLKIQKDKRFDYKNHARKLAFNEWSSDEDEEEVVLEEEMEIVHVKPPRRYANQLMLSEWMLEEPIDLKNNWIMKVCPIGKRNLVIASRGRIHCYTRSGYKLFSFTTQYPIPGGNRDNIAGYTVLDCIYSEKDKTFHVLDVMCWNQHAFYDCDTEFRFFWLASKFKEIRDDLKENLENENYKFTNIEHFLCSYDLLKEFLDKQNDDNVDGLLFYHKSNQYTFGSTPLVLWLKPNMLIDMFKLNDQNVLT